MMNEKQFEKLNNVLAFSIIVSLLFTVGNVAIYNVTLKGYMQNQILDSELEAQYWKMKYNFIRLRDPVLKIKSGSDLIWELQAFDSVLYFDEIVLLSNTGLYSCLIYTELPFRVDGNRNLIDNCTFIGDGNSSGLWGIPP